MLLAMIRIRRQLRLKSLKISIISIVFFSLTPTAFGAATQKPIPIKTFEVYAEKYSVSASVASGSCFSNVEIIFRDPQGNKIDETKKSNKKYDYITVYFSGQEKVPGCFSGSGVTFARQANFAIDTQEVRDYLTKETLWVKKPTTPAPISQADPEIKDVVLEIFGSRPVLCNGCAVGSLELLQGSFNIQGGNSYRPITPTGFFKIVGKTRNSLLVLNFSIDPRKPRSELWSLTSDGWNLLSNETFGGSNQFALTTDKKSMIYSNTNGTYGISNEINIAPLASSSKSAGLWKVAFSATKNGGGYVCGLINNPTDEISYFTHIGKAVTFLYGIDLNTKKVKKLNRMPTGFCLEDIDSLGNFVGEIRSNTSQASSNQISIISSTNKVTTLSVAPFEILPRIGRSVTVVGNQLVTLNTQIGTLYSINYLENGPKQRSFLLSQPIFYVASAPQDWNSVVPGLLQVPIG